MKDRTKSFLNMHTNFLKRYPSYEINERNIFVPYKFQNKYECCYNSGADPRKLLNDFLSILDRHYELDKSALQSFCMEYGFLGYHHFISMDRHHRSFDGDKCLNLYYYGVNYYPEWESLNWIRQHSINIHVCLKLKKYLDDVISDVSPGEMYDPKKMNRLRNYIESIVDILKYTEDPEYPYKSNLKTSNYSNHKHKSVKTLSLVIGSINQELQYQNLELQK
jgi:hypothetical protein